MAGARTSRIARAAGPAVGYSALAAVATAQALWMLLLGLAMAYGTPLGAPDSSWRGAAGVAIGIAAVLFGGGVAALAVRRGGLAVAGTVTGSAIFTVVFLVYPGLDDADAWTWATLLAPWAVAAVVAGLALRARRPAGPAVEPEAEPTTKAPALSAGAFVD